MRTSNADVELTATLYADAAAVQELIGSDLGGYYVVIDVKLAPKNNQKIKIWRDDFQLKTDRDGERAKPYAPSQIAGKGALIVSQTEDGQSRTGLGIGIGMIGMGGGGAQPSNTSKMDRGSKSKEAPVLTRLEEKVLKEQETDQPASGLLFFPMEPKQKVKDLQLTYSGPGSKLLLRFK